jgi:NTP pyrophosphatase (non-canonical NTP hydrolase)
MTTQEMIQAEFNAMQHNYGAPTERKESLLFMFTVLAEEVGEVASVLQLFSAEVGYPIEEHDHDFLLFELAQVAAVATTMMDMIQARRNSRENK